MSQKMVNSLLDLVSKIGKPCEGQDKENAEKGYSNLDILLAKALPEGFTTKKQGGGVATPPGKKGQRIRKYFWIRGEEEKLENNPVSISVFLWKGDDGKPQMRISVEMRTSPGKMTGSETQKQLKQKFFEARSVYESMLDLPLASGLSYWSFSSSADKYDSAARTAFVNDINVTDHIEVVKLIDISNLDDEKLSNYVAEAVKELMPYYKKATDQTDSETEEKPKEDVPKQPAIYSPAKVDDEKNTALRSLSFPKNVILFGPPGTGKTYNSIAYAEAIVQGKQDILDKLQNNETLDDYSSLKKTFDDDLIHYDEEGKAASGHICFTTFHQSYSYEDFIEGIFPDVNQKTGKIKYLLKPGVFKSLCDYANDKTDQNFVLIIDEINRGNISKIFGDLISLVEEGKRLGESNKLQSILPYSKDKWGVPSNVYIIGTMNTADRSIERLDTALRRRFHFIEMMPKPELLDGYDKCVCIADSGNKVIEDLPLENLLDAMNQRISYIYDRDHQIGHSYFFDVVEKSKKALGKPAYYLDDLANAFKREIVPLLQEYFYGNYEKIRYVLGEGDKDEASDIIQRKPRSPYVNANYSSIDDNDDSENTYEISEKAFFDIAAYKKILSEGKE